MIWTLMFISKNKDVAVIRYDQNNSVTTYFKGVVYLTWQCDIVEFLLLKSLKKSKITKTRLYGSI